MRSLNLALLVTVAFLTAGTVARAQQGKSTAVYTGGQLGAYQSIFCPAIVAQLEKAGFHGYSCTPTQGTLDNISRLLDNPHSVGFAQLDVFARWSLDNARAANSLAVIRTPACEGLWMVTQDKDMSAVTFGQIVGRSRTTRFAVAEGGSRASFEFLQKIDPNGLGRARNIQIVADGTAVINQVASGNAAVGFFVQFAEPANANIRLLQERKLRTVPVVNRELVDAKVGDAPVYQVRSFRFTERGILSGGHQATTACTPAIIATGSPDSIADSKAADGQRTMIAKLKAAADAAHRPTAGPVAAILATAEIIPAPVLHELLTTYDATKKRTEEASR